MSCLNLFVSLFESLSTQFQGMWRTPQHAFFIHFVIHFAAGHSLISRRQSYLRREQFPTSNSPAVD